MAYSLRVKYFNSFWLKKVVGDINDNPQTEIGVGDWTGESTVTTWVNGGDSSGGQVDANAVWYLSTWPGLPWGSRLFQPTPNATANNWYRTYPCFPFGGTSLPWNSFTGNNIPDCCNTIEDTTCVFQGGSLINRNPTIEDGLERQWFAEEARIRGGYNNTSVDFGVKAYIVDDENDDQQHRFNSLIYSGVFNSRTGINDTNVFNAAENITKSVDPANGSIQKLYAYDTNLDILQENKCSHALIDKDAVYSAEGSPMTTQSNVVIGQVVPYLGKYGISTNPESFAFYGMRRYFADKNRSAILRLSRDGITEISMYGMTDFFRDELATIKDGWSNFEMSFALIPPADPNAFINEIEVYNNTCGCDEIPTGASLQVNGQTVNIWVTSVNITSGNTCYIGLSQAFNNASFGFTGNYPLYVEFVYQKQDLIVGGFDIHNKSYTISLQPYQLTNSGCPMQEFLYNNNYWTLNFDEAINGWVSYYTYRPTWIDSLKSKFYSTDGWKIYEQHDESLAGNRGTFYGNYTPSSIQFIFNDKPSIQKNFQTINYEGTSGWQVDHFVSDFTEQLESPFPQIPFNPATAQWYPRQDVTNSIKSYVEGTYIDSNTGMPVHSGFYRKENRYVSNLINTSQPFNGEIVYGSDMSGIKGYFATVKISTDNSTDVGGMKELYSVGSKFVVSSQ